MLRCCGVAVLQNLLLEKSADIDPDASIEHRAMHGSPHHSGIEGTAPRVVGIDDRLLLVEACQVLASNIDGEMAKPTGDLQRQLLVGMKAGGMLGLRNTIEIHVRGYSATTIQLGSSVYLPNA